MPQIDLEAAAAAQQELASGESLIWAGRPALSQVFHREDLFMVPFSLMWGGFAIFWEAGVAGIWGQAPKGGAPWTFGTIWGVPFVVIGQYIIWGRFLYAAWKKRRTFYAVTNRRALVVQNGWSRRVAAAYLDTLPALTKESGSGRIGTLRFGPEEPIWSNRRGWSAWDGMAITAVPVFRDVEDVDGLYRTVTELREKAASARQPG